MAFTTGNGLYEFEVLPFGLAGAPGHFERITDTLLAELKWSECIVYLEDVIIFRKDLREHNERLSKVLQCFREAGLSLKPSKCRFAYRKLPILGHVVSSPSPITVHNPLQDCGKIYGFGANEEGQITGSEAAYHSPTQIMFPDSPPITAKMLAAGSTHSFLLTATQYGFNDACFYNARPHTSAERLAFVSLLRSSVKFLSPYSYMQNPIEFSFIKIKTLVRSLLPQHDITLGEVITDAISRITSGDCEGWLDHIRKIAPWPHKNTSLSNKICF
ncbi:hypothetical protein LAZ67_19001430 [Cordylochernes scorpioides]|uniref:Reverse transcriptase domain-containing protein n=1 Tax=Cordylochernes scorpioides TaxID=51811 RepID=A0ABY6LHN3_9ARAC|nr:hypothetical protein LAZ67_19001430 [Cordylochernes scorpioides]